ncbi:MAG: MFS transporter [Anaerolineales bacterium]|jgi:EmrB/QacA subfamily drug resistance transporter
MAEYPQTRPAHGDRRKWYVMASVGMGILLSTIDGSIVNVALPSLVTALRTQFATVQWVVLAYLLTLATVTLSMGRLGDMLGKKPIYTAGFIIFTLGSALCGLSTTIHALIGFRILQGLGAAVLTALGTAIVTETFPPEERGLALGVSGGLVSIGIVVGPALGGLILEVLTWHWIFFVNLPIGIIGTLMVLRYVPAIEAQGGQRFDFAGAATLFAALLSLLLALTIGQNAGFGDRRALGLFAAAAVLLPLFLRVEKRVSDPMIDLGIFRNRLFSVNLVTASLSFICIAGTTLLVPFFLEGVLGYNPARVGLLMAVVPVSMGVLAPLAGSLSDRFGTRPMTVIGLALMLLGYVSVARLTLNESLGVYLLRFVPLGFGLGIFNAPNNSAVMGSAPRQRLGVASGLLALTRILGQITGIAMLGAFWATRVAARAASPPSGGPSAAPAAAQLAGLQDAMWLAAVLMLIAFSLAAWALWVERRNRRQKALPHATGL